MASVKILGSGREQLQEFLLVLVFHRRRCYAAQKMFAGIPLVAVTTNIFSANIARSRCAWSVGLVYVLAMGTKFQQLLQTTTFKVTHILLLY